MVKIGRNDPCPCGSGKKYKKCCLGKKEIQEEVNSFVEQMLDNLEKKKIKFRGTMLENPIKDNLESLYLQCKYVKDHLNNSIMLAKDLDEKKHLVVYRKAKIIQKLLWNPPDKKVKNGKIFFQWGEHKEELSPEEYVDLILNIFSSVFEYYTSLLKNNEVFDCVRLAKGLGLNHLVDKINKIESLEELYEKLSQEAKKEYSSQKIGSLFSMKSYQVRCAGSHNDYSFKRNKQSFSIVLEDGRDSINFTELLKLSNDIFAKLNIIKLIPHLFHEGVLPSN